MCLVLLTENKEESPNTHLSFKTRQVAGNPRLMQIKRCEQKRVYPKE